MTILKRLGAFEKVDSAVKQAPRCLKSAMATAFGAPRRLLSVAIDPAEAPRRFKAVTSSFEERLGACRWFDGSSDT
jgi:hypothetical protein